MSEMGYPAVRARFGRPQRSSSSQGTPLHRLDTLREAPSSVNVVDEQQQPLTDSNSHSPSYRAPHLGPLSPAARLPVPRQRNGSSGDYGHGTREEDATAEEERQPLAPPPRWAAGPQGREESRGPQAAPLRPQWKPRRQQRP